jgi:hypothetical protein
VSGDGVFLWFWQQHAARQVTRLEEIGVAAALGSPMQHYCELCKRKLLRSDSFADHVSKYKGHMAPVQAWFELEGPSGRGWVQCWACMAEFNHLTLNVSTGMLKAGEGGSEVDAAVAGDRAPPEVKEQLCAAVQQVTGASGDQEEQEDQEEQADQWEVYLNPWNNCIWHWNSKNNKVSLSDPTVMESCGPTVSIDHTSGDGWQQHTSHIATIIAGTGGEPSESDVVCNHVGLALGM